ncbi:chitinase-like protein Idgf4 [Coccinella septempunctata]|uniref:chitinase-like protein Idgf4 n=1 Tax=Coccinella septempunctata TaxID=41139 RepID=UPI001D08EF5E|nr:chitinase-like protein Idgf4 [Coccinella septempunctata]
MRLFVFIALYFAVSEAKTLSDSQKASKVVCYYNSAAHTRDGQAKFTLADLESALPYCTHVIYGYAGVSEKFKKIIPLNENFDVTQQHYKQVVALKDRLNNKYEKPKFLLSVGGGADVSGEDDEKNIQYRDLLESAALRTTFVNSAYDMVKKYGFEGIDLAWEFPETKPKKIRSKIGSFFHNLKTKVVGPSVIDKKAEDHRAQFVALVRELKRTFAMDNLMVSVTVLPNVNSSVYYDPKLIAPHVDFVNLMAYDFYTPQRNPEEADYTSPLFELVDRRFDENVDFQVNYWTRNGAPSSKIVLGVPTFGRTWQMTSDSNTNGIPPLTVDGPGEQGLFTRDAGILSYFEICQMVEGGKKTSALTTPPSPSFVLEADTSRRRGPYAFLPPGPNKKGIWISYESPEYAAAKGKYAKSKGLGGIAISDLTFDDFKGSCSYEKYPLLRAALTSLASPY